MQRFLETYAELRDVRQSTVGQYQWVVRSYGKFLQHPASLRDLEPDKINAWLTWLGHTHSPYTVHSRRMTILSLWSAAYALRLAPQPEPRRIRRIKKPDRVVRVLNPQQVEKLVLLSLELTGDYWGFPKARYVCSFLRATFETALRQSDLHRLVWPDLVESDGKLHIVQQKTSHRRIVRFSAELMNAISQWHPPKGLVWPRPTGRDTIGRLIGRLGMQIGITGLTHTKLRQTAITDVERQRPGTGWIFAGHCSPTTTRTWYTDQDLVADEIPRPRFNLGYRAILWIGFFVPLC